MDEMGRCQIKKKYENMKHVKLFEEYRFFKARREFHPGGGTWWPRRPNVKDPNEPFFMGPKNRYHRNIHREETAAAEERQNARNLEVFRQQEGRLREYVEKIRNNPESIVKSKYRDANGDEKYGVILDDGTRITVSQDYWDSGEPMKLSLKINDEWMVNIKERRGNPNLDQYNEDDWNEEETLVDILGKLIIAHVKRNEIIL